MPCKLYITIRIGIDFHNEVVAQKQKTANRKQVDENDRKHGCQQDRLGVFRNASDYVEQRLFAIHHVQQLKPNKQKNHIGSNKLNERLQFLVNYEYIPKVRRKTRVRKDRADTRTSSRDDR